MPGTPGSLSFSPGHSFRICVDENYLVQDPLMPQVQQPRTRPGSHMHHCARCGELLQKGKNNVSA